MAAPSRITGFTLIELLISITVLSMVIGISTYAFSLFSRDWDGKVGDFELAAGQLQRVELLHGAIRDAAPWLVSGTGGSGLGFYFLGREEGMTFVTESPIFDARGLAVVRVFREREENAQTWRLVYEEASLGETLLRDASQTLPFASRLVILRGVGALDFRYYGWRSLEARVSVDGFSQAFPEWFVEYDGLSTQQQPLRIAMRLEDAEIFFDVAERDEVIFGRAVEPE